MGHRGEAARGRGEEEAHQLRRGSGDAQKVNTKLGKFYFAVPKILKLYPKPYRRLKENVASQKEKKSKILQVEGNVEEARGTAATR